MLPPLESEGVGPKRPLRAPGSDMESKLNVLGLEGPEEEGYPWLGTREGLEAKVSVWLDREGQDILDE